MTNCIDCKKVLNDSRSKRCTPCENKRRHRLGIINNKGKNNSNYKEGYYSKTDTEYHYCLDCRIAITPGSKEGRCKSCARKYQYATRPETHPMLGMTADLNPNWRGGTSRLPYPFEFSKELKSKIFKRDNFTCQKCNIYPCNDLTVHHIDYNKDNLKENNLITLCRKCNSEVNYYRFYWVNYFIGVING